ncbi:MAG: CTP-dependent riboflavin kinase [Deltaproteobacteria bacterium]|nr:CTP-dependent riboflavin kinase [Deltaproteobacteria bacterium]
MSDMRIVGTIREGVGRGAFFTRLDWVVEQFRQAMGFEPCPGTLNVLVQEEDHLRLTSLCENPDFELVPDSPDFCAAAVKRVRVNGIPAAIVVPSEEVRVHGAGVVEIMAECHVRDTLGLREGDSVVIEISKRADGPGSSQCETARAATRT